MSFVPRVHLFVSNWLFLCLCLSYWRHIIQRRNSLKTRQIICVTPLLLR